MNQLSPTRRLAIVAGLGAGLGCAHSASPATAPVSAAPTAASSTNAAAWTPSAEEEAVYKALMVRDPAPTCEKVEALAADPVAALTSMTVHASQPPWVGVRAATCLATRHAEAAAPTLIGWMGDPNTKGFAILLANSIDQLPEAVALDLTRAALAGPMAATLKPRLAEASTPTVRALAGKE